MCSLDHEFCLDCSVPSKKRSILWPKNTSLSLIKVIDGSLGMALLFPPDLFSEFALDTACGSLGQPGTCG